MKMQMQDGFIPAPLDPETPWNLEEWPRPALTDWEEDRGRGGFLHIAFVGRANLKIGSRGAFQTDCEMPPHANAVFDLEYPDTLFDELADFASWQFEINGAPCVIDALFIKATRVTV